MSLSVDFIKMTPEVSFALVQIGTNWTTII